MPRRMSCSLTVDQVLDGTKTVTRRRVDTWRTIEVGDRLTLIEKGMGLKKGERQRVLRDVEVVDVRVEPLGQVDDDELRCEGFNPDAWDPFDWRVWWALNHGYKPALLRGGGIDALEVRRIQWRYL